MDLGGMYREIVETSPDGIWVFDLDGRTIYANPVIAELLGVPRAEVATMTVPDSLDDLGKEQFAQHLADLRQGIQLEHEVEVRFQRRDGSAFWMLVRESPVHDDDGALVGMVQRFSDYTERRETVEALRSSRAQLVEAHQIARIGSWTYDVVRDEIIGSPELYVLYGMNPEKFPASYEQFLEIVHPEDRAMVADAVQQALEGADEFLFEARVEGETDWVWTRGRGVPRRDATGAVVAMSGTHQDVSESKRAELALLDLVAQNTLLQAVAVAANESRSLREVLSQAQVLLLGHDDWERGRAFVPSGDASGVVPLYVSDEDRDADRAAPGASQIEQETADAAFRRQVPVWDRRRLTIAFPVTFEGEVCAVLTITSAPPLRRHAMVQAMAELVAVQLGRVAERERAEQRLAATRDAAMEASRQKSEFLATMSHEIRTPLNGVIGLNDLLLRTPLDHEQHRLSSGVQVAGRALLGVINDILDFSKMEAGRMELERLDFEVRPVFDQIASVLGESARSKGVELIVSCHPHVPETLSGDPTRLAQVLTNLVSNAVKFTDKGEVFVRAESRHLGQGTVELTVEVVDTGVGLDAQRPGGIEALFAPFTQADPSITRVYGGTGLGLAISKEIVEAMDGSLSYAANPDGGSVFSFTSVFGPPVGSASDPADEQARRVLVGKRVLVVDDNARNRMILEEQLLWWRIRTVSVESADEAMLALARAHDEGDPFDGALLDMAMPVRNGLQLAEEVRSDPSYDDLALLMLTSSTTVSVAAVRRAGIADCLTKPVLADVLRGAMVQHLVGVRPDELADPPATEDPGPERRILVVEDNPVNQLVATGLLESMGYEVEVAEDGLLALDLVERGSFDAILMDVQMPRMDGYTATRAIRELEGEGEGRRTPIIAMTAAAVEGERERCLEAGMDDFLTKPVDPTALGTVLAALLDLDAPDDQSAPLAPPARDPAPVPPGTEDLEVARLDMLRDLDSGNTDYLDRAIGNFIANSAVAVETMREAILAGDAPMVRMIVHKLVGSALNLGVAEVAAAGRQIEFIADMGVVTGTMALLPALEAALTDGRLALLAYQSSYSRGGA